MGIFSRNFDKPGPGVSKDEPRKKGAARFFELFFRDFGDLVKLSLLFSLTALPSAAVFVFTALPFMLGETGISIIFLLISLLLAFPIGGGLVACYFNITRLMRDDPSYVWYEFKRKFKENWKQAAPTGIVCTAFVYMQILIWFQMYYQMVDGVYTGGIIWLAVLILSFLLFVMITPYIFMHLAYVRLGTLAILKNSFLMSFAYLPRSFMGALLGGSIWVLFAFFMPNSLMILPLVPLILASLSMMLTLMWAWPPFNKFHNIEESLIQLRVEREKREEI